MREHDLELLELPAVLARLAAATASEPGADLAAAVVPSPDPAVVELLQRQTADAIALLDEAEDPDLGGAADVREAADHAERGGALDPAGLVGWRGRSLRASPHAVPRRPRRPAGADGARRRHRRVAASVAEEIGRTVEEDGSDLRDSASPALRRLRRELRDGRGKARGTAPKARARPRARRAPPGRLRHRAGGAARTGAEGIGPWPRAGDRARLLGLGADALRGAARGRRGLEPAARGRGRRARRGDPDPPQPLLARRHARRGVDPGRRRGAGARPRARARHALARLEGGASGP